MKSEEIKNLFEQFEAIACEYDGVECWSARELCSLLGYAKWDNFTTVIEKAKEACNHSGEAVSDHFPDVRKTIAMPKGASKNIDNYMLTRGIVPEYLPAAEDIKKVERRLSSEEKKINPKK